MSSELPTVEYIAKWDIHRHDGNGLCANAARKDGKTGFGSSRLEAKPVRFYCSHGSCEQSLNWTNLGRKRIASCLPAGNERPGFTSHALFSTLPFPAQRSVSVVPPQKSAKAACKQPRAATPSNRSVCLPSRARDRESRPYPALARKAQNERRLRIWRAKILPRASGRVTTRAVYTAFIAC